MRMKLFLAFIVLIFLMTLGTAYLLYQFKQQQFVYVENDLSAISQRLGNEVKYWTSMQVGRLHLLASLDSLKGMLPKQQQPILQSAVDPDDWSSLLFITNKEGHAVIRSDSQPLLSYSDRGYISKVLDGGIEAQQLLISHNKPMPLQCFSVPIYQFGYQSGHQTAYMSGQASKTISPNGTLHDSAKNKKMLQGVLVQCAALEYISRKFITSPNGLVATKVWLVDDNNRLIAHSDIENHAPKLQSFRDHPALLASQSEFIKAVNVDGEKLIVAVSTLDFGWRLIVQQPYNEAYGQYEKAQSTLLWLNGMMIIVAMFFAGLLARHLSLPLQTLTASVEKLSKGRFSEVVPYADQSSDIGRLAKAIDRIALNLRLALKRIRSGLPDNKPRSNNAL
ncbi:MAG: hypothetical protein ACI8VC_000568 [Candidatus Endobugula sp.]|jgi:hypothetical protein